MPMKLSAYRPGPGMMVSAAFIGPGTVTACTLAGANFGFALIWALVFATITTIILQSFAVRIALVSRMGLAEAMMASISSTIVKVLAALLLIAALLLGNAAYEAGNISGAVLGVEALAGTDIASFRPLVIIGIALLATGLLLLSRPRWVERVLIALVLLMSGAFLSAFLLTRPDFAAIFSGFVPRIPEAGLLTAIALIGTTIVPYNLFLHAASARRRWDSVDGLPEAQTDNIVSIGIGGLISITILATAAASLFGTGSEIANAADMARQLDPVFGSIATLMLGLGLFAAGLTSAITAPLATGYIMQEIFGRSATSGSRLPYILGIAIVLLSGTIGALLNYRPVEIIFVAQIANGLLLPIIAGFLLYLANNQDILQDHVNDRKANFAGILILLITGLLGVRLITRALGIWP
ncbi:NRAMP (natural resistance-associated macrophage protein) metal ion transporters [Parasphingorhabdus marina DSM 22363]|uniref:NRAMP (Natural resistance-associated macrophage protein) metal ion transporters n=2 Tax=Parasphingorhabdus marina TaxID=394732 RepID=A0A1N6GE66_9SPHN|nr:NRAMP (natural resistance-associated macrophage protein) metal ion transporters [Parasphingorhabdus marina DSM 22363]